MTSQYSFTHKNTTTTYTITGNGAAVVLLHGFAEDGNVWYQQVAFLQNHYKIIVPDLPGSGKSEMLTGDNVSIEDYADCVYALLQKENVEKCVMIGHSMGGYITLAFTKKYPQLLSAFGFVHSSAFADSEEKKATRKKGIETMKEYGAYAFIKNTTGNLFGAKYKQEHPEKVIALIEAGKQFTSEALQQYYTAMMSRPDTTDVLRSSEVPVLFIIGTQDVAAPMQDVLKQVHLPVQAYIKIIENVGHMGMWEATEIVNNTLLTFIDTTSNF